MDGTFPDVRADERASLEQFLEHYRRVVVARLDGIDATLAGSRVLAGTDLTLAGIVKHLARVEDFWFHHRLLGLDPSEPWASAPHDDADWDFHSAGGDDLDDLRELYAAACARSRAAADSFDSLDVLSVLPAFHAGSVSLRWIFLHMIEETARHAGHADILRDEIYRRTRS